MGLPISRSIIEAHGGRLWATKNEVHGAVFQFVLPTFSTSNCPIGAASIFNRTWQNEASSYPSCFSPDTETSR